MAVKLNAALLDVELLYIEAAPLIYYVEEHPAYVAKMDAIVDRLENNLIAALASTIILTEVLFHPVRSGNSTLEQQYLNILLYNPHFQVIEVSAIIARTAARLRVNYNLRTPDALHLATAIETGCQAFLTNDLDLRRVTDIRILALDDLELGPPPTSSSGMI